MYAFATFSLYVYIGAGEADFHRPADLGLIAPADCPRSFAVHFRSRQPDLSPVVYTGLIVPSRSRTDDLTGFNRALYQLSY